MESDEIHDDILEAAKFYESNLEDVVEGAYNDKSEDYSFQVNIERVYTDLNDQDIYHMEFLTDDCTIAGPVTLSSVKIEDGNYRVIPQAETLNDYTKLKIDNFLQQLEYNPDIETSRPPTKTKEDVSEAWDNLLGPEGDIERSLQRYNELNGPWNARKLSVEKGYDELESWKIMEFEADCLDEKISLIFGWADENILRPTIANLPEEQIDLIAPYLDILSEESENIRFKHEKHK